MCRSVFQKTGHGEYCCMEQSTGYEKKLITLKLALESFEKAMSVDLSGLGDIEKDTMKNGQIQKFEISIELFWKTMKKFLHDIHGIETVSPKMTIKQLYMTKYTDEKNYETLLGMINDRNRMSHIYSEEQFSEIYNRLSEYLSLMQRTVTKIKT